MRVTARIFALLDVISIALTAPQFWFMLSHLNAIPNMPLSKIKVILFLPLFVSLFISAYGLWFYKKLGFVASYIQFPLRLIVWVFSLGFITYLPEWLNLNQLWFNALFKICFIAEFFRLYFTIKMHRSA